MSERPDDVCPRPDQAPETSSHPLAPAIYPTSVWMCNDTHEAYQMLAGQQGGYVYQRDGHPNADQFLEKCRDLHAAPRAAVTSSGMSALSLALLSQAEQGDHLIVANELYGRSLDLLTSEATRLGITHTRFDLLHPDQVEQAVTQQTKLVVVETITNPQLEVADIGLLAEIAHRHNVKLLVDNTFATPVLCQPLKLGADLVLESVSKAMNGHSDVMLGLLCGKEEDWERVPLVLSAWGLASSPFDCWLGLRGLISLPLRVERACQNAMQAAEYLERRSEVSGVVYPGLPSHPQHELARRQLSGGFGTVVTFHLSGGRVAADGFIRAASRIPFCPSLGEACTTLSHPASTSHRGLSPEQCSALGIQPGTIRLSLGIESPDYIEDALGEGLAGAAQG